MKAQEILELLESNASGREMDRLVYGGAVRDLDKEVRLGVMACAVPERFDASLARYLSVSQGAAHGQRGPE